MPLDLGPKYSINTELAPKHGRMQLKTYWRETTCFEFSAIQKLVLHGSCSATSTQEKIT